MDDLDKLRPLAGPSPTADRPLMGMTVLVVEDSRFACESMRLLCLRSGARIRRADSVASARRHFKAYRPAIAIIDLGLPDGSGADLIEDLARATPRIPLLLGMSGDNFAEQIAISAGADGFLSKPVTSIAAFQSYLLMRLPRELAPASGLRVVASGAQDAAPQPDPLAFQDDMAHVLTILSDKEEGDHVDYVAQFTKGVARSAADQVLEEAAVDLAQAREAGRPTDGALARLVMLAQDRMAARPNL